MGSKMKVLLVQDVEKLGRAGELKDVSGGFGRNYLIPQGFAVIATPGQIKQAEQRIQAQQKRFEATRKDAEGLAARINGKTVRFDAKVGEQDRLYGSVTNADLADRLMNDFGVEVDRRKILLEEPIKRVGRYDITIRLMNGVEPVVHVEVVGEGEELPEADTTTEETVEE